MIVLLAGKTVETTPMHVVERFDEIVASLRKTSAVAVQP